MNNNIKVTIDDLAWKILEGLKIDFRNKNLSADALNEEYIGASINALEEKYCSTDRGHSKVDFDLAIKHLEKNELAATGPTVPYENPPNSNVVLIGLYSKREFIYLTEKGYRATKKLPAKRISQPINVNFSGNFDQSSIGIGNTVNQTIDYRNQETVDKLYKLIDVIDKHIDDLKLDTLAIKKVNVQIATIKAQLEDDPDSVIVRQAGRTLRNITEGAIGSLVATATQPTIWVWVSQTMQKLF